MESRLWRITGTSKGGNPVRMTVRAADYFEALEKASRARVLVRDIVLQERESTAQG